MEWGVAATNAAWATSSYRYRFSESRDRNLTNLTGPTRHGQQTKSPSIEHALGIGGVLHVNAVNVIQHVRYFCAVNPDYQRRRIVERGASTNK